MERAFYWVYMAQLHQVQMGDVMLLLDDKSSQIWMDAALDLQRVDCLELSASHRSNAMEYAQTWRHQKTRVITKKFIIILSRW